MNPKIVYGIMLRISKWYPQFLYKEKNMEPKYKRVLLKVSGEALAGPDKFGICDDMLVGIAAQVKEIHDLGV